MPAWRLKLMPVGAPLAPPMCQAELAAFGVRGLEDRALCKLLRTQCVWVAMVGAGAVHGLHCSPAKARMPAVKMWGMDIAAKTA